MLDSTPPCDCMYNPLISADEAEFIVLVRLSMLSWKSSRTVARLSRAGCAKGVSGLAGDSWGGGGSGSGFPRLCCRLKLLACCVLVGGVALAGKGAEEVAFSMLMSVTEGFRIGASLEGWRVRRVRSSRLGARFLMPRKADDR